MGVTLFSELFLQPRFPITPKGAFQLVPEYSQIKKRAPGTQRPTVLPIKLFNLKKVKNPPRTFQRTQRMLQKRGRKQISKLVIEMPES